MKKYVLITNLDSVNIGAVRTFTNALLLVDDGENHLGPRYRARGFHNEAGNPTFDVALPSIDYTVTQDPIPAAFAGMKVNSPESRGGHFTFKATKGAAHSPAAVTLDLCADIGNELGLDVQRFEGPDDKGNLISSIWDVMVRKVVRYYHAPFIMLLQQHSATAVASALGVKREVGR